MKRVYAIAAMVAGLLLLPARPLIALAQDERPVLVEMENSRVDGKPLDNGAWIVKERYNDVKALGAQARAFLKGNETRYDALAPEGSALKIDSRLCGVIVRPGPGDQLQISYWGETPQDFTCQAQRCQHGTLLIRLEGPEADKTYVNTHDERLYNVFVLEVPAVIHTLALDGEVSLCRLSGLDMESVEANGLGASIVVDGDSLSGRYTMEDERGWVRFEADAISGLLDLKSTQGWLTIKAGRLAGEANLSVDQGWATVKGGSIEGAKLFARQGWLTVQANTLENSQLCADQGWVTVEADSLGNSQLSAQKGWVTVEAGSLGGVDLAAPGGWNALVAGEIAGPVKMEGEWVSLELKRRPKDLGLNVKGRFTPEGVGFEPPKGWEKLAQGHYAVGGGSPALSLDGEWIEIKIAQ